MTVTIEIAFQCEYQLETNTEIHAVKAVLNADHTDTTTYPPNDLYSVGWDINLYILLHFQHN